MLTFYNACIYDGFVISIKSLFYISAWETRNGKLQFRIWHMTQIQKLGTFRDSQDIGNEKIVMVTST